MKKNYKPDVAPERTFTAFIVKGNRQVITREVVASKRFRVEEETYIIKDECIYLKNIDGNLKSVSYYREGNPNPYSFEGINKGLTPEELDRLYAEDFYNIIVNIQPDKKSIYMLLAQFIIFGASLGWLVLMIFDNFIF